MKLNIFISLAFSILLFSCGEKKTETDLIKNNLSGKIKSITTSEYLADSLNAKSSINSLVFKEEWKYNENGFQTEGTTYQILASDTLSFKTSFKYDDRNRRVNWFQNEMDGSLSFKFAYTYDANGNNTEESRFSSDSTLEYTIAHIYNDKGQITEDNTINSTGGFHYKAKRKYDDAGNVTEMSYYHANNVFDYKVT
jgi:hypothetical protein